MEEQTFQSHQLIVAFLPELQLLSVFSQQLPIGAAHFFNGLPNLGERQTALGACVCLRPSQAPLPPRSRSRSPRGRKKDLGSKRDGGRAHLSPGALQSLLQQKRELLDLALQAVVVTSESAKRRLEREQIGPHACKRENFKAGLESAHFHWPLPFSIHSAIDRATQETPKEPLGCHSESKSDPAEDDPPGPSYTPARFSWTAFISSCARAKASSMARFLSSSMFCISSSICSRDCSSSDSYTVTCRMDT